MEEQETAYNKEKGTELQVKPFHKSNSLPREKDFRNDKHSNNNSSRSMYSTRDDCTSSYKSRFNHPSERSKSYKEAASNGSTDIVHRIYLQNLPVSTSTNNLDRLFRAFGEY